MFKVGDRVKVREDLKVHEDYGTNSFAEGMIHMRGKTTVITKIVSRVGAIEYKIKGKGDVSSHSYDWTDEMLIKLSNLDKMIKIKKEVMGE